jgi:hypothetical protein
MKACKCIVSIKDQPVKGDFKIELGRVWIFDGKYWELSDIQHNVITKKNAGSTRLYSDRQQSVR